MRSYRPEELFDDDGATRRRRPGLAPAGDARMGANPHANGGVAAPRPGAAGLRRRTRSTVASAGRRGRRGDPGARRLAARRDAGQRGRPQLPRVRARTRPSPTGSARVYEVTDKAWKAGVAADRRAPGARRPGDGDPHRAHLPGLAGGLPADRPARAVLLLRGVRPHRRLDGQPARQVAEGDPATCRGAGRSRR